MLRRLLAASALTLAALDVAAVQTSPVLRDIEDDDVVVAPFNLTVDQLDDMTLVGAEGAGIGEIEDVLMDEAGQPVAVAAEVGDFLGVDDRDVVIPLDQLTLSGDRLATALTREAIEALPDWDD